MVGFACCNRRYLRDRVVTMSRTGTRRHTSCWRQIPDQYSGAPILLFLFSLGMAFPMTDILLVLYSHTTQYMKCGERKLFRFARIIGAGIIFILLGARLSLIGDFSYPEGA